MMAKSPRTPPYICVIHANVLEAKPGKCPICGLALVPEAVPDGMRLPLLRLVAVNPLHLILAGVMLTLLALALATMGR